LLGDEDRGLAIKIGGFPEVVGAHDKAPKGSGKGARLPVEWEFLNHQNLPETGMKNRKWVVVLDPKSVLGDELLRGTHDGITTHGRPVVRCTRIEEQGAYLYCERIPR